MYKDFMTETTGARIADALEQLVQEEDQSATIAEYQKFPYFMTEYLGNDATEGEMDPEALLVGQPHKLKANRFEKSGHEFIAWEGSDGNVYHNEQVIYGTGLNAQVLKLTAQWRRSGVPMYSNLDSYSIEDLSYASRYLEELMPEEIEDNEVYQHFLALAKGGYIKDFGEFEDGALKSVVADVENDMEMGVDDHFKAALVGVLHDDRADGNGKVGLSFMALHSLPYAYQMNASNTNNGGWQASKMRNTTLASGGEIHDSIPTELMDAIVPVLKKTNNTGLTTSAGAVTETTDKLWLPSGVEVYGSDFGKTWNSGNNWDVYKAEGEQYEFFKELGVTFSSNSALGRLAWNATNSGKTILAREGTLNAGYVWFRSPSASGGGYHFVDGTAGGGPNNGGVSGGYGVLAGFCI